MCIVVPMSNAEIKSSLSSEVGGIEEAAIEFDVGAEAATGVEAGVSSDGVSKVELLLQKLFFAFCTSSYCRRAWLLDGSLVVQGQLLKVS